MGASIPTPLDVAASIDWVLRRNIQWPLREVVFADSPVTVTTLDRSIMANAVGGALVINLPDATLNKGMFFEIKKTDISGNTVTIQSIVGGQTIDGAGAKVLIASNDFIVVESDGANYKIVALVISAPGGGGAVFYTVKKIVKTDGIVTLVPVDGTLIPFSVAVDGECSFWAAGVWSGFSPGVAAGSLNFRIDGVDYAPLSWGWNNGSGGDFTSSESLSPHISLFLTAGPHTVELVASNTVLGLNASPANPLTLSVLFPAASFATAAPTPKAATLVVHPVPGVGDFTTIEAALAAIGVLGGGYILVREGTYTPPVGGYILPDAPVEIIGCGSTFNLLGAQATLIDLGAAVVTAFTKGFKQQVKIADLTVRGTGIAGQAFFDDVIGDGSNYLDIDNVHVDAVQSCFISTAGSLSVRLFKLFYTPDTGTDASFWSGGTGIIEAAQCSVVGGTIIGFPEIVGSDFHLDCTLASGPFVNLVAGMVLSSSFLAGEFLPSGGRATQITGCSFGYGLFGVAPVRYLDLPAAGGFPVTVTGNDFIMPGSSEEIRNAGDFNIVADNTGFTAKPRVLETGVANNNRYDGISSASTITGEDSTVDGAKRADETGATTDAFVTVFTHLNLKGLLGIGTIKNTDGADSLDVRETVTDAFGVTDNVITPVAAGNDYLLDPQTNFATARPPYVSYAVAVRSTVAGNPATFELHHVSQGAM